MPLYAADKSDVTLCFFEYFTLICIWCFFEFSNDKKILKYAKYHRYFTLISYFFVLASLRCRPYNIKIFITYEV